MDLGESGEWPPALDDDVAQAVKDDLILDPKPGPDGRLRVEDDVVLGWG
jgi:hypothetical protein